MSTTNELPNDFSGTVEEQIVVTTIKSGERTILSSYIKHYANGVLHREDGPAVEIEKYGVLEWWLNGIQYTEEQHKYEIEKVTLNEKLHTTLVSRPTTKRGKI